MKLYYIVLMELREELVGYYYINVVDKYSDIVKSSNSSNYQNELSLIRYVLDIESLHLSLEAYFIPNFQRNNELKNYYKMEEWVVYENLDYEIELVIV